mgnify:CR=1 FL=1
MQGTIQNYIDSSISSTVNLREDIPIETVADIYTTAYENGLKGITVYREGSREGILITNDDKEKDKNKEIDTDIIAQAKDTKDKQPRIRPTQTQGLTRRIKTGEGTLYITINEDERGLCEVFTTIGKAGGNAAAQSEAISRLISLSLRSGIDPRSIVRQLKGISGPNPTWEDGRLILSTPDAIGKAMDDYLKETPSTYNNSDIDKTFVYGKLSEETYKFLKKKKRGAIVNDLKNFDTKISKFIKNGDFLMIKGSNATRLNEVSKRFLRGATNAI